MTEELIKVIQGWFGYLHAQGLVGVLAYRRGRLGHLLAHYLLTQCQLPRALGDHLGIESIEALAVLQRLLHARSRVLRQQLQDAHVVPPTRQGAVPCFQTLTQILENRRQTPLAIDIGMIQSTGPTLQRR